MIGYFDAYFYKELCTISNYKIFSKWVTLFMVQAMIRTTVFYSSTRIFPTCRIFLFSGGVICIPLSVWLMTDDWWFPPWCETIFKIARGASNSQVGNFPWLNFKRLALHWHSSRFHGRSFGFPPLGLLD